MRKWLLLITGILMLTGCALIASQHLNNQFGEENVENRVTSQPHDDEFYDEQVKPILESRCISCHACYDAPCQLKLTAPAGIERGGSKDLVYDGTRLLASTPSRLFIDETSTEQWRAKGFHPVLNERQQSPAANLQSSLLYRAVALRKQQGPFEQAVLSDEYDFSLARDQQCSTIEEYGDYESSTPHGGMPYGLPELTNEEFNILSRWLAKGGKMPAPLTVPADLAEKVRKWEARLNGNTLKDRLVARYIYEHIYLYSLYLDDGEAYRFKLVRSTTPPGKQIDQIATRRPYDDPKVDRVYYRLWLDPESKVQKNHIPMQLDEARYLRWLSYFYDQDYDVLTDPGYQPKVATNPFKAFAQLPADGRYRFLLDHAQNTIMAFIKGPVCRGQVAVNVINDHFWVYFVDPDTQYHESVADFLEGQQQHLEMPAQSSSNTLGITSWLVFAEQQKSYLAAKAKLVEESANHSVDLDLNIVWDGYDTNDNAVLTVFRHFDNATVLKGMVGQEPKTAWLIDYPLLERIHYLLVAGFDVYGNIGHQLVTRLYMDFLRMEGEANFLLLLPKEERRKVHQYWYRDANQFIKDYVFSDYIRIKSESKVHYHTERKQSELYQMLAQHLNKVLNHERDMQQTRLKAEDLDALLSLQDLQQVSFQYLPNTMVVLVTRQGEPFELFSVLHNMGHANISSLLNEASTRLPEEDGVTLAKGVVGDYPNAFMQVEEHELTQWAEHLKTISTVEDYQSWIDLYGIRRTHPNFWWVSDEVARLNQTDFPRESGILDYNRLENR
ncbi:fatty acid cis/trans isomerase [Marinomonas epiphytica]